ncbi:hypothetical protein [Salipaludibacillus daqingensis]|uniref:hypothetical protein n=1 Tax=Salipaludibacillus daqingensis TaxID=3041001 RepID=UPI002476E057|nr:hypothetical protein [Salipaludibacillus daqingensis]
MKKLSSDQFLKAVDFIMTHARPLDRKLFDYYFNNASNIAVLNELAHFQNEDGGIGHGIEPDIRMPQSSPIATSVALQYTRNVNTPWRHPFIKSTMKYLEDTYDRFGHWPLILPEMKTYPHAEWWGSRSDQQTSFQANPGAEIIGYFHAYSKVDHHLSLPELDDLVMQDLEGRRGNIEFHEVLCYLRLIEELSDHSIKKKCMEHILDVAVKVVTKDPQDWGGYCAKPLWLASSPDASLYPKLEKYVQLNLDYEIEQQHEDGSWLPFWQWGQYIDVWEQDAKPEWKGFLTVQTLRMLQQFDRIDSHPYQKSRG